MSVRAPPREGEGTVVGRLDLGESDRILRLLTPDRGRVSLLARGARAPRSRWASLDLAARVRYAARRSGSLEVLAVADVAEARGHLRDRLEALLPALYACELCGALAREDHAEPRLFGLLETALALLEASSGTPGSAFVAGLEAKALAFAGVGPVLDRCGACDGPIEATMAYAASGLRHPRCVTEADGATVPMTGGFAAALRAARDTPLRALLDTALPPGPLGALADTVEAHTGRALAARAALDVLR